MEGLHEITGSGRFPEREMVLGERRPRLFLLWISHREAKRGIGRKQELRCPFPRRGTQPRAAGKRPALLPYSQSDEIGPPSAEGPDFKTETAGRRDYASMGSSSLSSRGKVEVQVRTGNPQILMKPTAAEWSNASPSE